MAVGEHAGLARMLDRQRRQSSAKRAHLGFELLPTTVPTSHGEDSGELGRTRKESESTNTRFYWGFRTAANICERMLAEGAGFEPALRFPVNTLSKRAPSATRPPLRTGRGTIVAETLEASGGFRKHSHGPRRELTAGGIAAEIGNDHLWTAAGGAEFRDGHHDFGSEGGSVIGWFSRFVGLWFIAGALVALVIDATKTIAASALTVTPLGSTIAALLGPGALASMQEFVQQKVEIHVGRWRWDPLIQWPLRVA